MIVMTAAMRTVRGSIFSWSDDSVLKSCMPAMRSMGNTATAVTMMPMPPSHWSRARHSRIPVCLDCRSVTTVAPVVVSPAVASNRASA